MGTAHWVATTVLAIGLVSSAHAGPKDDIRAKSKAAMESYDLMDYDAAKKQLNQALAVAKKAKLDKDPVTARLYLELGIATLASGDAEAARVAFLSAVQIDPAIQINVAYKTPELIKMLDEAKSESSGGSAEPVGDTSVDCTTVRGLQHKIVESAPAGAPLAIEAHVGDDLTPVRVSVMYRVDGAIEFSDVKLTKQGCTYTGEIPASAMKGSLIHYYVAAIDGNNKPIATKGASGSPNIIEISGVAASSGTGDTENPIGGGSRDSAGDVSGGVVAGGNSPKVLITVAGGTGFGYVSGATEGGNMVEKCCVGNSLVVLTPELAYHASPKLSIGVAARVGLPLGANINAEGSAGHSTIAPAALLRVRFALAPTGEGVRFMGQAGYGVMRNTIKLLEIAPGMDTDIVGQGPLLLGAGVGYLKRLGKTLAFVADVSALAGIAVTKRVSTTKVNTGVGADISLGFAVGF